MGGLMLLFFGYEGMGIALGSLGILSSAVFWLLAVDPTGGAGSALTDVSIHDSHTSR